MAGRRGKLLVSHFRGQSTDCSLSVIATSRYTKQLHAAALDSFAMASEGQEPGPRRQALRSALHLEWALARELRLARQARPFLLRSHSY